jgi:hypothetical protein
MALVYRSSCGRCIAKALHTTWLHPYGYLPRTAYRHTTISSSLRVGLGVTFLPVAWSARCLLSNCSHCSLFQAVRPKWYLHKVPVGPRLSPSASSSWCTQKLWEWSVFLQPWLFRDEQPEGESSGNSWRLLQTKPREGRWHQAQPSEKKKWRYACKLFGANSLMDGAM